MPYCSKCGAEVPAGAAYCPHCGQPQPIDAPASPSVTLGSPLPPGEPGGQGPASTHFLSENVAGLLCYVLGWITGLIFFLMDKRPLVRFHAAQSMIVFGGLVLLDLLIGAIFGAPFMALAGVGAFGPALWAIDLIRLVGFVLWIVLMIKAFQGQRYHVPIVGEIAENIARKQAHA